MAADGQRYRIEGGKGAVAQFQAIVDDIDLRLSRSEGLNDLIRTSGQEVADRAVRYVETTVGPRAAELEDLLEGFREGVPAASVVESAARYFLSDARTAAILADALAAALGAIRGGVDPSADTLAKLLTVILGGAPAGRQTLKALNDAIVANTAAVNALTTGADPLIDTFAEVAAKFTSQGTALTEVLAAIGNRLRGDADGGYSDAVVARFLANLRLTDRQPGVGDLVVTLGNIAPAGCLKLNGAALSRTTYAGLWAWVQANTNLVTDAAFSAGATAAFSQGDGSTTFRIPDFRGEFPRFWDDSRGQDSGRGVGTVQAANLPNHQHSMPMGFNSGGFYGWFDGGGGPISGYTATGGTGFLFAGGSANSGVSIQAYTFASLLGLSGELRPRNVSPLACIRYK